MRKPLLTAIDLIYNIISLLYYQFQSVNRRKLKRKSVVHYFKRHLSHLQYIITNTLNSKALIDHLFIDPFVIKLQLKLRFILRSEQMSNAFPSCTGDADGP